jgi:hypothetical protein
MAITRGKPGTADVDLTSTIKGSMVLKRPNWTPPRQVKSSGTEKRTGWDRG